MAGKCTFLLIFISTAWFYPAAQIGTRIQQESIVGHWQNTDFGITISLSLDENGSGLFDGDPITYSIANGQLNMTLAGTTETYQYTLHQNMLNLSGGDLPQAISFTRVEERASPDGYISPSNAGDNEAEKITGQWSGNNESIEFRPDGNCVYLGQTFPYQAANGIVRFITSQGNVQFAYTVMDNKLTLSANGQQVIYNRVSQQSTNAHTGKGEVAMDLVGQWCWIDVNSYNQGSASSSRCITLNADGTYTYSSDASRSVNTPDFYGGTSSQSSDYGTWYVQGDRIHYHSNSVGTGSYKLERRNHPRNVNDPMIVLDGEAFVTATARPPWK